MDEFDFRKVAEYMARENWTWHSAENEVPTEREIRQSVRSTMRRLASDGGHGNYSGGFDIRFFENKDKQWLRFSVHFVIEGWHEDGTGYAEDGP
jgi:hypothetical protein